MIENSITSVEERLPHLSVYFLGRMLHALFTPHKHIYQTICHFLLQRPVFDFHDVPMFYGMFCSSNLHFRQDQNWLLEMVFMMPFWYDIKAFHFILANTKTWVNVSQNSWVFHPGQVSNFSWIWEEFPSFALRPCCSEFLLVPSQSKQPCTLGHFS